MNYRTLDQIMFGDFGPLTEDQEKDLQTYYDYAAYYQVRFECEALITIAEISWRFGLPDLGSALL